MVEFSKIWKRLHMKEHMNLQGKRNIIETKKAPVAGAKTISVEVVHGDGSRKTFEYHTDREYLGEVLKDEELVDGEESAYGLFIMTVDGETIDEADQEWWCITRGGKQLNTGADQTPIADGEDYELTFTIGY